MTANVCAIEQRSQSCKIHIAYPTLTLIQSIHSSLQSELLITHTSANTKCAISLLQSRFPILHKSFRKTSVLLKLTGYTFPVFFTSPAEM